MTNSVALATDLRRVSQACTVGREFSKIKHQETASNNFLESQRHQVQSFVFSGIFLENSPSVTRRSREERILEAEKFRAGSHRGRLLPPGPTEEHRNPDALVMGFNDELWLMTHGL